MTGYILRRLIQLVLIVWFITVIVFFIMRALPGDPVLVYVGRDVIVSASPEQIEALRHEFGLDQPIVVQYINWLGNVLHGDLGRSVMYRTSVSSEIARALPKTLYLGSIAFVLSIILGIPLGVIAAVRRGKWIDTVATLIANVGVCAPVFWVGIIMILLLGFHLRWLPIQGFVAPNENLGESLSYIVMPVICLIIHPMASVARQTRSAMLEVIRQDYIRTAWAKGLTERSIIIKHAAKNSLIPVLTVIGLNIRNIFGGQVLVETVFNIPGMGRLSVDGLFSQDYAIVQGVILIIAMVVVLSNLFVDLAYGWIDPRIRYE
jgi:peptide/nickel transport system permease protein